MPLFTTPQAPWALLADDRQEWAGTTGSAVLQSTFTYISAATLLAPATLTGFRYRCSIGGNGNCDIGIYDNAGNLLTHTGATLTVVNASGTTISLGTAYPLSPGKYYLAFWINNATDSIRQIAVNNGVSMSSFGNTGGTTLSSSISPPLGSLGTAVCMIGLLSGGWS